MVQLARLGWKKFEGANRIFLILGNEKDEDHLNMFFELRV